MNIAFSAIILVILLLPGTTAISAYYSSLTNKASGVHIPFNELIIKGLVISALLHSLALEILQRFGTQSLILQLYHVVSGQEMDISDVLFQNYALQFLWYNLSLILIAFILSKIFKWFVQKKNFDLKYNSLRTTSYWFHMFGGRHLEEDGNTRRMSEMDIIYVDILTEDHFLYSGRLADFNYSPQKDELENIILANAQKRRVNGINEEKKDPGFTESKIIPGEVLLIRASTILNINIIYARLTENENDVPNNKLKNRKKR